MNGQINIDRFSGEAAEPSVWGHCSYCGAAIYEGYTYFAHEGLHICGGCAKRYAYALFEEQSAVRIAQKEAERCD